jgi:hypothetical protein
MFWTGEKNCGKSQLEIAQEFERELPNALLAEFRPRSPPPHPHPTFQADWFKNNVILRKSVFVRSGEGKVTHTLKTPTLDGDEWSASRSGSFTSGQRLSGTHWTGS